MDHRPMSSDHLKIKFILKIIWIFRTIILYTIHDGFVFLTFQFL